MLVQDGLALRRGAAARILPAPFHKNPPQARPAAACKVALGWERGNRVPPRARGPSAPHLAPQDASEISGALQATP